jgi:ABC-type sugar transport system ATPase subunit
MRLELAQLQQRLAATMIHVTHDQVEAMTLGQRIAVMLAGRIEQVGTPQEVYEAPANRSVAEIIGSPPMRFLHGILRADQTGLQWEGTTFRLPLPADRLEACRPWTGREVLLGLRPEAVRDVCPAPAGGAWLPVRAEVVLQQPLGPETILELRCGPHTLAARVEGSSRYARGTAIDVFVNTSQCHLFDPTSGARL